MVAPFLEPEERKLYELIWKKFVASQMKEALEEVMTVLVEQVGGVRIPGDALLDARTVGDLVELLARYSRADLGGTR